MTRQLSVSSDSKLLDGTETPETEEAPQVILRQRKPPRPKSEVFLSKDQRRSKRYSAFGVSPSLLKSISGPFYWLLMILEEPFSVAAAAAAAGGGSSIVTVIVLV